MEDDTPSRRADPVARLYHLLILVALCAGGGWLAAKILVSNPFSPAGSVGYVYEEPRFWGNGGYRGTLEGPASFGASWKRLRVVNLDVGPRMHTGRLEDPGANASAELGWELQVRPDPAAVRAVVERFGGKDWYERHVKPVALRAMRDAVRDGRHREPADAAGLEAAVRIAMEREMRSRGMPFFVDGLFLHRLNGREARMTDGGIAAAAAQGQAEPPGVSVAATDPEPASPPPSPEEPGPAIAPELEAWVDAAPPTLIDVSHRREFRGMWLATVSNVDWPSRSGLSPERQQKELITYLDGMEAMNMNALIFQVRSAGDAFYESALDPWSCFLTGTQGKDPGYDPLAFAIEECRKRSIEVHAWFNPFRAMPVEDYKVAANHITKVLPQFARPYASMTWMDPGAREVRDFVTEVILDVVTRYDIDGVHLDDYFYPYPEKGAEFDDSATYKAYLQCCGEIERGDWRRQNVDSLIAGISRRIRAAKPHVKFGVSPFGLYRPGEPEGTVGFDQYNGIHSDPKKWLEHGWIDYVTPQLYWREKSNRSYSALLNWWGETNVLRRHIYAGNSLLSIERRNGNWPFSEYQTQLNASREAEDMQSLGNIFFGMRVFRGRDGEKLQDRFASELYPAPALPPAMPWLGNRPPDAPWHVRAHDEELRWDPGVSPDIKHWALYRRNGEEGSWDLTDIFPVATTRADVAPGTYALSAVDRLLQESVGVVVEVRESTPAAGEAVKRDAVDGGEVAEGDAD